MEDRKANVRLGHKRTCAVQLQMSALGQKRTLQIELVEIGLCRVSTQLRLAHQRG
jgi:hypothetical protein